MKYFILFYYSITALHSQSSKIAFPILLNYEKEDTEQLKYFISYYEFVYNEYFGIPIDFTSKLKLMSVSKKAINNIFVRDTLLINLYTSHFADTSYLNLYWRMVKTSFTCGDLIFTDTKMILSTGLHELGHFLGLYDFETGRNDNSNIMYSKMNNRRMLTENQLDTIRVKLRLQDTYPQNSNSNKESPNKLDGYISPNEASRISALDFIKDQNCSSFLKGKLLNIKVNDLIHLHKYVETLNNKMIVKKQLQWRVKRASLPRSELDLVIKKYAEYWKDSKFDSKKMKLILQSFN